MKRKHKGRKIYKTKEKNYYGKSPLGKFLSGVLTVLLIGGIGFIGYSVAEPIINYTQHKGDEPETTAAEPEETTSSEEPESTVATVPSGEEKLASENYKAVALTVNALSSINDLRTALSAVQSGEGIEFVEVPLKAKGGYIYYASSVSEAKTAGAVQSNLTLSQITSEIKNSGYRPAAVVSTFYDNVLPTVYPDSGYVTYADGLQWIDDDVSNGGKPWTSPYSQRALDYLSGIVDEVSSAGFERVVCSDFVYPYFRQSDLDILDEQFGRSDRFMALTSAANLLYDRSVSNGVSMYIEVSATDILRGGGDVLQPMLLSANTVVVNIDVEELQWGVSDGHTLYEFSGTPAEITDKCLKFISEKLTDLNVVVRISGSGATAQELIKAKEKIADYGYKSFVIG